MPDEPITRPRHFFEMKEPIDDLGVLTLAAAMALAAVRHVKDFQAAIPPLDDLGPTGLDLWKTEDLIALQSLDIREIELVPGADAMPPAEHHARLYAMIKDAIESGRVSFTATAVAFGLSSPDPLVRACALTSAIDLFRPAGLDLWSRLQWFLGKTPSDMTRYALRSIFARCYGITLATGILPTLPPPDRHAAPPPPKLMLIHGTVLPTSQDNKPVWSVPGSSFFEYLKAERPDLYDRPDYFQWEGGYTRHARRIAAGNLKNWVEAHQLGGIDVAVHSHGCNVLMAALANQTRFGRVVLLSCPVHWGEYYVEPARYAVTQSVRIRFDFVILFDRGAQRFPHGTIPEHVLPYWFTSHSEPTSELVWQAQNIVRYLK